MGRWRPVEEIIPKDPTKGTGPVLLKDQYGTVVIGAWRPWGGPWIIEGERVPMGARYDVYQPLPK